MTDDKKEVHVNARGRVTLPKQFREEVGEPPYFLAETDGDQIILTPAQVKPLKED